MKEMKYFRITMNRWNENEKIKLLTHLKTTGPKYPLR